METSAVKTTTTTTTTTAASPATSALDQLNGMITEKLPEMVAADKPETDVNDETESATGENFGISEPFKEIVHSKLSIAYVSLAYVFKFRTYEEVEIFLREYEIANVVHFVTTKQNWALLGKNVSLRTLFAEKSNKGKTMFRFGVNFSCQGIEDSSIPFFNISGKKLCCQHGKERYRTKRDNKRTGTKKWNCPAEFIVKEIVKFPRYGNGPSSKYGRRDTSNRLRNDMARHMAGEDVENIMDNYREFYVFLTPTNVHTHPTGLEAGQHQNVDPLVKRKISATVRAGLTDTDLVKSALDYFIREMFKGRQLPSASNRRFYPANTDIRNHVLLTKQSMAREFEQSIIVEEDDMEEDVNMQHAPPAHVLQHVRDASVPLTQEQLKLKGFYIMYDTDEDFSKPFKPKASQDAKGELSNQMDPASISNMLSERPPDTASTEDVIDTSIIMSQPSDLEHCASEIEVTAKTQSRKRTYTNASIRNGKLLNHLSNLAGTITDEKCLDELNAHLIDLVCKTKKLLPKGVQIPESYVKKEPTEESKARLARFKKKKARDLAAQQQLHGVDDPDGDDDEDMAAAAQIFDMWRGNC